MKVDLERLRRSLARYVHAEENAVPVAVGDLEALLAVVDAGRALSARELAHGRGLSSWGHYQESEGLRAALAPFAPPADRAWEEVDRWNAEQRDLAVKAAVAATPKPVHSGWAMLREQPPSPEGQREWAREYVALVGEVVQRQFRSDQERIAELERERDALRKELDARRSDLRDAETTIAEDAADSEELVDRVERLRAERDWARARLARVPALVAALRYCARPGAADSATAQAALAEWEKP